MQYVSQPSSSKKNVNVSESSYGAAVWKYLVYSVVIIVVLSLVMWLVSIIVIPHISPEQEYEWFGGIDYLDEEEDLDESYESLLASLPVLSSSTLQITQEDEANAYSTPGRRVYLTTQFIEEARTLEELYFVLGHEYGHMQAKDALQHLFVSIPVSMVSALLFQWDSSMSQVIGRSINNIYSREAELKADIFAVEFVYRELGHVWCVMDFLVRDDDGLTRMMTRWSSHPVSTKRTQKIREYIYQQWYPEEDCSVLEVNK